ncbi:hypothetical protein [Paenibacillus tyrfis]|uniref:hypothetical protein n=1 Tax=Paenibacillus tyrfis TaxID=1501230 RepID=UPI00117F965D|nr:hypothetical protein [Paenibacillus tyrfis]
MAHSVGTSPAGLRTKAATRAPGIHTDGAADCRRERPVEEPQLTFDHSFLEQLAHHRRFGRGQRRWPRAPGHAGSTAGQRRERADRGAAVDV